MDIKQDIFLKIPFALNNLKVAPEIQPLVENYIQNLLIAAIIESRNLSGRNFKKLLEGLK